MIDGKIIQHIAKLSRLKISEAELQNHSEQLSKALGLFDQIAEIDTTGIEPLVTPVEIEIYLRPDKVAKEFTAEEIIENAPDKAGNLFKVPPVIG